jgi:hypothetical protein
MTTTWLNAWSSDLVPASARAWWLAVQQWLGAAPDLPSLALMDGARRLGWALVLACLVWRGLFGLWRLPGHGRGTRHPVAGAKGTGALAWLGLPNAELDGAAACRLVDGLGKNPVAAVF